MNRRLERLLLGLLGLGLAVWLSAAILGRADQASRRGDLQMRQDALLMLWSPAVFAAAGGIFLVRALLLPASAPALPRPRWAWRPQTPSTVAVAPRRFPSRYEAACRELGLEPGVSWAVVRATWRRQLPQWHPDNGGDPQRWLRRQAAYQLLEAWEDFGSTGPPL